MSVSLKRAQRHNAAHSESLCVYFLPSHKKKKKRTFCFCSSPRASLLLSISGVHGGGAASSKHIGTYESLCKNSLSHCVGPSDSSQQYVIRPGASVLKPFGGGKTEKNKKNTATESSECPRKRRSGGNIYRPPPRPKVFRRLCFFSPGHSLRPARLHPPTLTAAAATRRRAFQDISVKLHI